MSLTEKQLQENKMLIDGLANEIVKKVKEEIAPAQQIETYMQELLLAHIAGDDMSVPTIHPALQSGYAIQKITDKPKLVEQLRKSKLSVNNQNAVHVTHTQKQVGKLVLFLGITAEANINLFLERVEQDKILKSTKENQSSYMSVVANNELAGLLSKDAEYKIVEVDKANKKITLDMADIKEADSTPQKLATPLLFSISFYPFRIFSVEKEAWLYVAYKLPSAIVAEVNLTQELKEKINAKIKEDNLEKNLKEKINQQIKKENLDTNLQKELNEVLPQAKSYADEKIKNNTDWMATDSAPSSLSIAEKLRTLQTELEQKISLLQKKNVHTVMNETEQKALVAFVGDFSIRDDNKKTYLCTGVAQNGDRMWTLIGNL